MIPEKKYIHTQTHIQLNLLKMCNSKCTQNKISLVFWMAPHATSKQKSGSTYIYMYIFFKASNEISLTLVMN